MTHRELLRRKTLAFDRLTVKVAQLERQLAALRLRNLQGEHFDDMIDQLILNAP